MNAIKNAIKGGHGTGVLYAGLLGLLASDLLPTPADGFYFLKQQRLKEKFIKGEITAKQYWTRETLNYYMTNGLWWTLVIGAVWSVKGDFRKKSEIAVGLIASGVVVGVIFMNIKKDEELQKRVSYQ